MNFKDLGIKYEYRSSKDNIVEDFLIPVMSNSVIYKRSVGYFTSKSLIHLAESIDELILNNGKIKLVISPNLTDQDIEAIERGYELRKEIIGEALVRELKDPETIYEKENLNKLSNLIAHGYLDIKVAVLEDNGHIGIYHEKLGILEDSYGNKISFSGSMNESHTAFYINYETIDVFRSWVSGEEQRTEDKVKAFERIWGNKEDKIVVKKYPEFNKKLIKKYKYKDININENLKNKIKEDSNKFYINKIERNFKYPELPEYINLYNYQEEAIKNWLSAKGRGIFDMATGTGKTFTALAALVKLSSKLDNKLGVIIVCPFQHLVEQWVDDLKEFNIDPIVGYSSSKQKNWEKRLEQAVRNKRIGIEKNKFFCFITTNATFTSEKVQKEILRMVGNNLIIVDEAHNFGTEKLLNSLPKSFNYRLALSATFERHMDEFGTKGLYNYFGKKVIEYSIGQAIRDGKLTEYSYKPILVSFTDSELEEYLKISKEIRKQIRELPNGKKVLSKAGQMLAIKRSRVVAGARNKLKFLLKEMEKYKDKSHILVYCGSTNIIDYEKEDVSHTESQDIRQIDAVTDILGNQLDMRVSRFTSNENIIERELIKKEFAKGEKLQALAAIKCLDEGVNIPEIRTAFILASTTNPKEYIQRRGRVLRLSEGKEYAEIYDFITLPRELESASTLCINKRKMVDTLLKNEIKRMEEFGNDAFNKSESLNTIDMIKDAYMIRD